MEDKCTDCGTPLNTPYPYVRCLRPGEDHNLDRDPLCTACWRKDLVAAAKELKEVRK